MFSKLDIALYATAGLVQAHTVITYPGWRGDNLITNESWPFGMQWIYPCGGMPPSTNRTKWPVSGGAIAIQPGWFQGHANALFYINMGFGETGANYAPTDQQPLFATETIGEPPNMSFPMLPVFQVIGPSKNPYPGTFCLPQVPLPANTSVNVGDNATIQIVETAVHGAALFNCVDITFAEPEDVAEVNASNCFNSSTITFASVFAVDSQSESSSLMVPSVITSLTALISTGFALWLF